MRDSFSHTCPHKHPHAPPRYAGYPAIQQASTSGATSHSHENPKAPDATASFARSGDGE
jgi:hypothetical protein